MLSVTAGMRRYNLGKMKVQLVKLAHARSGDKGDTANVGLIALRDEYYSLLVNEVTAEAVKEHFGTMVKGEVERFELPNLNALNFLLHGSLGGGGLLGERARFQIGDIGGAVVARGFVAQALRKQAPDAEAQERIGQEIFFEQRVDHGAGCFGNHGTNALVVCW